MNRFHVYCLAQSSDMGRLQANLARSPEIVDGKVRLTVLWNEIGASGAYARSMLAATAEILVFAHCDVYFPIGWFERLAWEVDRLTGMDRDWAVAGISSMTRSGELVGRIYDSAFDTPDGDVSWGYGNSGVFGKSLAIPVAVASADELVLIMRRGLGVSFDPLLPGFHLYGTDIMLEAQLRGKTSYGLDMPAIHNAKPQLRIGRDYALAYRYMVRKWRDQLPVPTTCGTLTATPFTITFRRLRAFYRKFFKRSTYSILRVSDPHAKAAELGFDKVLALAEAQKLKL
jgi:hypothetical protein